MYEAETTAIRFMQEWSRGINALRRSIEDYFTDSTVWENVGLNKLIGKTEALAFVDLYHASHGLDSIEVDTITILSNSRHVMTERVDRLLRADGSLIHETRLMGLYEIADGLILAQRDYFCPAKP